MYAKLSNSQLNLATSFARFQMEKYGNVLVTTNNIIEGEDHNQAVERRMNTLIDIEQNNLNETI